MLHCTAPSFRSTQILVNFDFFRDTLTFFGFMEFQLFGRFDQLNALAGLPHEPRNVPCAPGHLPGPLGPATAKQRPKFLNRRIFGLSDLRGHFTITQKSESPNTNGHKYDSRMTRARGSLGVPMGLLTRTTACRATF